MSRGGVVQVQRDSSAIRLIDFDSDICAPNEELLGETVESQSDFDVEAAIPHTLDNDIVIMTHIPSREKVMVRKNFDGAKDKETGDIIDIDDYNVCDVDSEDTRIGYLENKDTGEPVVAIRDFAGAKIVDYYNSAQ